MSDKYSRDSFEYLSEDQQDFTLESILAEFKGSAYIAGDKKTSPDLLDERIRRIVRETQEGGISDTELYSLTDDSNGDFFADIRDVYTDETVELTEEDKKLAARTAEIDWEPVKAATSFEEVRNEAAAFFAKRDEAVERREEEILREKQEARRLAEEEAKRAAEEERRRKEEEQRRLEETKILQFNFPVADNQEEYSEFYASKSAAEGSDDEIQDTEYVDKSIQEEDEHKTEILFFDNYRFAESDNTQSYAEFDNYESYGRDEAEKEERPGFFARIFGGKKSKEKSYNDDYTDEDERLEEEPEPEPEPEVYVEEPDFAHETTRLGKICNKLMLNSRLTLFIALIMGVFTVLFDKGVNIFGIGNNVAVFSIVMVIMQLVVMLLSMRILTRGAALIFRREIGAETLILFSSIMTYIAGCVAISNGANAVGTPFCAVSAFACAFSMWGEYRQIAGMYLSLKTTLMSETPQILSGQYLNDIDTSLIRKFYCSPEGFYNKLVDTDLADQSYKFFSPLLLIAAVLLSVATSIGGKVNFVYCLSAVAAAAGSFSAMSAFAVPFSKVAKKLRKSGAAVAGWGGADDIYYADGVRLTDGDIFPGGAQVSGPTALDNVKPDKILRYSASLMIASNSGLSKGFEDLMNKQGIAMVSVENFECYEGGYAAVIRGERVVCGSAACMALLGLRIPQSVNSKNAIFTAINDTVVGAFSVTYKPSKNIQKSLVSLLRSKVKLYFAVRDFNITPLMVQQKLQIPVDDIEYLPSTEAYRLTADVQDRVPNASAVIAKNLPTVYAETVTMARSMRTVTLINTALSIITTVLGMLVVFLLSWSGDGTMISPSNLMTYMLVSQFAIILLSNAIGIM